MPGPLDGVGVVVTRPARQAGAFAQKLAALGAEAIVFPAIVILPPDDETSLAAAHAQLGAYDLAIFISANAVEYGVPAHWPTKLIALGPGLGTVEALAAVGITNARMPATTFDSEGLLALPELVDVRNRRIVIFRGEQGRELLADTLRERGARVDTIACYRRAAPTSGAAGFVDALRHGRAHALTLTSSEGLDNLWTIAGEEGRGLLATLTTFAPHPRIAQRARDLGLRTIVTPGGDAGLIAGLLEWGARTRPAPIDNG